MLVAVTEHALGDPGKQIAAFRDSSTMKLGHSSDTIEQVLPCSTICESFIVIKDCRLSAFIHDNKFSRMGSAFPTINHALNLSQWRILPGTRIGEPWERHHQDKISITVRHDHVGNISVALSPSSFKCCVAKFINRVNVAIRRQEKLNRVYMTASGCKVQRGATTIVYC